MLRGFNLSGLDSPLQITKNGKQGELLNLLEETVEQTIAPTVRPYEIRTIGFEEE